LRVLTIGEFDDDCADAQPGRRLRYAVLCPEGRAWQPGYIALLEIIDRKAVRFRSHAAAANAVVAFWHSQSERFPDHRALVQQGIEALGWLKSNAVLLAAEIVAALRLQVPFKGEPAAILGKVISGKDARTGAPRRLYRMWQHVLCEAPALTALLLCNLSLQDSRPRLLCMGSTGLSGYTDIRHAVEALRAFTSSRPDLPGLQDADEKWRRAAAISRKLSAMLGLCDAFPPSDPTERIRNTNATMAECFKLANVLGVEIRFEREAYGGPTGPHSREGELLR